HFLAILGSAAAHALSWPLAALAQEPGRTYRLGVAFASPKTATHIAAFFDELRLQGFIEGQNLAIDGGYGLRDDQLADFVAAMAKSAPEVIFSTGDLYTRALRDALPAAPIVVLSGDLMMTGFVQSFARP